MKLSHVAAAAAMLVAVPAFASSNFLIDFEKGWDYSSGDVNDYYNGGSAADGTSGPNFGVSFVGVSGLSNDADFTYYLNAPSMLGTAYAHTFDPADVAFMNVAAGVDGGLSFYFSTPAAVQGAIKAWSGLNGTGTLLGTFDIPANTSPGSYDVWTQATFSFAGTARSFDLTSTANLVGLDNIAAVPEPSALLALLAGVGVLAGALRRQRR